jgi:hypothetical protein
MIERLLDTLETLAAPADVQLTRHRDAILGSDALARDYADALRLVIDCPQIQLEWVQRRTLERVEEQLDAMSAAPASLWTEQSVRVGDEWGLVRTMALQAIGQLGGPRTDRPSA